MILLDTHIWIWWVSQPERLQARHREILQGGAEGNFAFSIISCWEIAKLVEYSRLKLDRPVERWIETALADPQIALLHLYPRVVVESTELPQPFHRDPADQLLVATARIFQCAFMTEDSRISSYPHVRIA